MEWHFFLISVLIQLFWKQIFICAFTLHTVVHAVKNTCKPLCCNSHTRTHTRMHTQSMEPPSDFHINMSSYCRFLHGFLLVSAVYITWIRRPSTMRAEVGWGGQTLPYCMPTSMHNLNNRPCHWNKSQAFSGSGPSHTNSNFILPQQKIGAGGINLWSIPNISPTIWGVLAGLLYISMGDTNNLLEMYYITPRRMTKLATAQSDENNPNRTLQFHGDTAWCNEVTLWLPPFLVEKFNAIWNVKGVNVK